MQNKFTIKPWASKAILYEVNIRQYTPEGTFNAFVNHLPRLQKMGVTIIWLMPITPISQFNRQGSLGSYYACSSYTNINEEFGTIDDFKNLVNVAHTLGIKVIIDWVANHTGFEHEWTTTNKDFYRLDEQGNFTERNGWKDVIDLNYENKSLHIAMIEAMQFWIKNCNIDGFRCDMAHLVPLEFWKRARLECDNLKELFWLAECDENEYLQVFDVNYAWQWMHQTERLTKGESGVNDLYNVLHHYSNNTNRPSKLFFTSNHDENSWNGTEYEKYGKLAKAFAVFCFTWQGFPLIYSGQEVANNKRLAFFDKDEINWNNGVDLFSFYKTLSVVHQKIQNYSCINLNSHHKTMAFLRIEDKKKLLVILNLSNTDSLNISIENEYLQGKFYNIFTGNSFIFNEVISFELMAGDFLVYANHLF